MQEYGKVFVSSNRVYFVSCLHCIQTTFTDFNKFKDHVNHIHLYNTPEKFKNKDSSKDLQSVCQNAINNSKYSFTEDEIYAKLSDFENGPGIIEDEICDDDNDLDDENNLVDFDCYDDVDDLNDFEDDDNDIDHNNDIDACNDANATNGSIEVIDYNDVDYIHLNLDREISLKKETNFENKDSFENVNLHNYNILEIEIAKFEEKDGLNSVDTIIEEPNSFNRSLIEKDKAICCEVCGKSYNSDGLRKHYNQRSCGRCRICYKMCSNVYRHIRTNHKEYYKEKKRVGEPLRVIDNVEYNSSKTIKNQKNFDLKLEEIKIKNNGKIREVEYSDLDARNNNNSPFEAYPDENDDQLTRLNGTIEERCVYCGETFQDEYFQRHQNDAKCGQCPICLSTFSELLRHIEANHKEYVESRQLLKKEIAVRIPLTDEDINHKKLFCAQCKQKFKYKRNFDKHLLKHKTKENTCKYCGKIFKYLTMLNRHIRIHTDVRPYKCNTCSLSFNESGNLKKHFITRHTEGLKIKCSFENCGKIFKTNARKLYHEAYVHTGKYKHLCHDCGLIYPTLSTLMKHTKQNHNKYEDRQFSCEYCDKKFIFKFQLRKHVMIHLGIKQYKCDICTKDFTDKENYKKHYRAIHGKEITKS